MHHWRLVHELHGWDFTVEIFRFYAASQFSLPSFLMGAVFSCWIGWPILELESQSLNESWLEGIDWWFSWRRRYPARQDLLNGKCHSSLLFQVSVVRFNALGKCWLRAETRSIESPRSAASRNALDYWKWRKDCFSWIVFVTQFTCVITWSSRKS